MEKQLDQSFIQQLNKHLGIAYKVGRAYFMDRDEREDAIQEMMYQLWRSYPGFHGRSKFSTWMYSVCLNTALTHVRKRKSNSSDYLREEHLQIPEHESSDDENVGLLFETIATLSPINKAIVLLYLEDLSYDEIVNITGVSKANVSVRLVRIKRELEEKMKMKKSV